MIRLFDRVRSMQDYIVKMYDKDRVSYGSLAMAVVANIDKFTEHLHNMMLNRLSAEGYDIDFTNCNGVTPLAEIIKKCKIGTEDQISYISTVKKLISLGADVTKIKPEILFNLINAYGSKLWSHKLVRSILLVLIDNGANYMIPDAKNRNLRKASLLHKAIECGDVELVDLLSARKCKVNIVDNTGRTPLHYLFDGKYIEKISGKLDAKLYVLADLLFFVGADINREDYAGITPALELVFSDRLDVIIKYRKRIKFDFGRRPVLHYITTEYKEALLYDKWKEKDAKRRVIEKITRIISEEYAVKHNNIRDETLSGCSRVSLSRQSSTGAGSLLSMYVSGSSCEIDLNNLDRYRTITDERKFL